MDYQTREALHTSFETKVGSSGRSPSNNEAPASVPIERLGPSPLEHHGWRT